MKKQEIRDLIYEYRRYGKNATFNNQNKTIDLDHYGVVPLKKGIALIKKYLRVYS